MNKDKKLFRLNYIDIIILITICIIAVGLLVRFNNSTKNSAFAHKEILHVTFFSESVDQHTTLMIKEGLIVKDKETNAVFGKVIGVELNESVEYWYNSEGICVVSSKPGFYSVSITVEGEGQYTNHGAKFRNREFYLNKSFQELYIGDVIIKARIYDIKKL